jgi:hypothetical protein
MASYFKKKNVEFYYNKIKELDPFTFNELISLKEIIFSGNSTQKLDSNINNVLISLKKIKVIFIRIIYLK